LSLITIDLDEIRGFGLADLLVLSLLVALMAGLVVLGKGLGAPYVPEPALDLTTHALVVDSLWTLVRGFAAIGLSLVLACWWGLWAASSRRAERLLLPLIDILQSIPVLGFMPGLVLGMVGLFPSSRLGLELAGVLLMVTAQAWNMILAFYQSNKAIPRDLSNAADAAGLKGWRRFVSLSLPSGARPLAFNAMLSMAGGWFFLMAIEAFQLGDKSYRLPGLGAYMATALEQSDSAAMGRALLAMAVIVVAVDQLVWRPLLAFVSRFQLDGTGDGTAPSSWVANLLQRSQGARRLLELLGRKTWQLLRLSVNNKLARPMLKPLRTGAGGERLEVLALGVAAALLAWIGWRLLSLLQPVSLHDWAGLWSQAGLTLLRVLAATALASLVAIPLGVRLGLDAGSRRWAQPLIQIAASFPATMLFPLVLGFWMGAGLGVGAGSAVLMVGATFWTILFNSMAGAAAIGLDQREAWAAFGRRGWPRWKDFLLPALLPDLLVGWETAMVAAWNASIVTEYLRVHGATATTEGLGATINLATEKGDFGLLTAAVLVMVVVVVATNRLFWHRLNDWAKKLRD